MPAIVALDCHLGLGLWKRDGAHAPRVSWVPDEKRKARTFLERLLDIRAKAMQAFVAIDL